MMTLNAIALATGTDRSSIFHDYCRTYDAMLSPWRDQPIRLLEMGVLNGAGLVMWAGYFSHPMAQIVGVDIHPEWCRAIADPRVKLIHGSYTDPAFWDGQQLFDVIIDDSNHIATAQMDAFPMAWEHVRPGGLFILEDVHSVHSTELSNAHIHIIDYFARIATQMQDIRGAEGCAAPDPANQWYSIESIEMRRGLIIVRKRP